MEKNKKSHPAPTHANLTKRKVVFPCGLAGWIDLDRAALARLTVEEMGVNFLGKMGSREYDPVLSFGAEGRQTRNAVGGWAPRKARRPAPTVSPGGKKRPGPSVRVWLRSNGAKSSFRSAKILAQFRKTLGLVLCTYLTVASPQGYPDR